MPNGSGRNLDRLFAALMGFKAKHGHWPTRVRANKGFIDDVKGILTTDSYEKLVSKVALVRSQQSDIRAEDDCGLGFAYGDSSAEWDEEESIESWLGLLNCIDDEDDTMIFLIDD